MNYLDEMEIYDKLNLLLIKGQYFQNTFTNSWWERMWSELELYNTFEYS